MAEEIISNYLLCIIVSVIERTDLYQARLLSTNKCFATSILFIQEADVSVLSWNHSEYFKRQKIERISSIVNDQF